MRKGLKRFGGALRRVATVGVTAALALGMAVTGPVSAIAEETTSSGITLDKAASPLDKNNETDIALTVNGSKTVKYSDVVFVIDRSTSVDVLDEAMKMIDELASVTNENNLVKVGVVRFERTSTELLPLTTLTQDNVEDVKNAIRKADDEQSSGTNIQTGIYSGMTMLDADTSVEANAKHLVLVTDGVTYLWGKGNTKDNAMTIYDEAIDNGEERLYAYMDKPTLLRHHDDPTTDVDESIAYYDSFNNVAQWMADNGERIAGDIASKSHRYVDGVTAFSADELGQHENSTYYTADGGSFYDTNEDGTVDERWASNDPNQQTVTASNTDAAIYEAVTTWQEVEAKGYHSYAFASDKYAAKDPSSNDYYPWSAAWVASLDTLDKNGDGSITSQVIPSDKSGMFDGVRSDILYSLGIGSTVHDVMGGDDTYDFDFVNDASKLSISLQSGKSLAATKISENTYGFGNQLSDGSYEYELVYYPEGTGNDNNDSFTLTFNVPVAGNAVTLNYSAKLVQAPTTAGEYDLATNEVATLTPQGGTPTEFPKPTVHYTLKSAETGGFVAKKELVDANGNELDLKDGQFKFQVKDAEGNVIDEATNDAEGDIQFKKDMTFDAAGDYTYTIFEVNDGQDGITYDTDDVTVTVHVADTNNDGDLDATWSYADDDMTFTNVSTAKEAAPSTTTNSNLPKTSDPTSLVGVGTALVGGLGAGAAGLVMRRRNR